MRDRYEIQNVKPDVIIYLDTPTDLAYRRLLNDESQQHCKSETNFLREAMLLNMDLAYESFLQKTDIPHHTIRVTNKMTPRDVGNEVYSLIRQEMCAEGGSNQLYSCEFLVVRSFENQPNMMSDCSMSSISSHCIWCGHQRKLIEGKKFCHDCQHAFKHECITCHRPYPNGKNISFWTLRDVIVPPITKMPNYP